jgi:hypothetical protein
LENDFLHKIDGRIKRKMEILKKDIFKKIKTKLNKNRIFSITEKIIGNFYLIGNTAAAGERNRRRRNN